MDLIKDTQTEWEGPPKPIEHPNNWTPILNPIDENRSIPQEQLYVSDSEPEAELGSEHEPKELDHDQLWE